MPASLLITTSPLNLAIVLFSMALFGHQFWSTILQTLAADIFPSTSVGSVAGLMGAAGSVGAMFFNYLVGILLSHYAAYPVVFTAIGLLYPLSFIIIWLMVRKIEPLNWRGNGAGTNRTSGADVSGQNHLVELAIENSVATVRLNHPPLNILTVELRQQLLEQIVRIGKDPTVRLVIFQARRRKSVLGRLRLERVPKG